MGQVSRSDDMPVASGNLSLFGGSSGHGSKASTATSPKTQPQQQRQFETEKAGLGTLDQVVSKYVDSTGPSTVTAYEDTGGVMESKECLLSTQVPYSDESSSSTSASRPNADTAESSPTVPTAAPAPLAAHAAAGSPGLFSLSSEVESTYGSSSATTEVCNRPSAATLLVQQSNHPSSRNPDNLESILPSSLIPTREYHHPHAPHPNSWAWDMPVHPSPASPNFHGPVDVMKQEYNCDSHHSGTWQNLCELPDGVSQFYNVVDSGHDVMDDVHVKHHEQQLLQLHQVGSPTSQWQMNLQGVGENNSDSFNPMAEWEAARCQDSTFISYGLSDSHSGLCNDLYMLDNVTHYANSSSSLQYPVYDDNYLFPHLLEESMLYV